MQVRSDPSCCAVSHICGLSEHNSAEIAMTAFCKTVCVPVYKPGTYKKIGEKIGSLVAFYIFTGVVRWVDKGDGDEVDNTRYGPEFEAYIKKHKLGVVVGGPARMNRGKHDEHIDKVWIWAPSEKGLQRWLGGK